MRVIFNRLDLPGFREYGPQYTKEERILAQNATKRERKKRRAMVGPVFTSKMHRRKSKHTNRM